MSGRIIAAALTTLAATVHAHAQDRAYDWSGFYVGAQGGYGWNNPADPLSLSLFEGRTYQNILGVAPALPGALDELFSAGTITETNETEDSELYGLFAGYRWQHGNFVFGGEAEAMNTGFAHEHRLHSVVLGPGARIIEGSFFDSSDVENMLTLRGRAGWAFDRILVSAAAGMSVSEASAASVAAISFIDPPSAANSEIILTGDGIAIGWTLGVGVEVALTDAISLRIDYQHVDFGEIDVTGMDGATPVSEDFDLGNADIAAVGVSFRF